MNGARDELQPLEALLELTVQRVRMVAVMMEVVGEGQTMMGLGVVGVVGVGGAGVWVMKGVVGMAAGGGWGVAVAVRVAGVGVAGMGVAGMGVAGAGVGAGVGVAGGGVRVGVHAARVVRIHWDTSLAGLRNYTLPDAGFLKRVEGRPPSSKICWQDTSVLRF